MGLKQLFTDEAWSASDMSPDDVIVAATILLREMDDSGNSAATDRAAAVILAAPDTSLERILEMFSTDIETLALIGTRVLRRLGVPWDGHVASLDAALQHHPRAAALRDVLRRRVWDDLRAPRFDPAAQQGWKFSANGELFLEGPCTTDVLRSVVEQSPNPLPALLCLARRREVRQLRQLMRTTRNHIPGALWVKALQPLPPSVRRILLVELLGVHRANARLRSMVQDELELLDSLD
jgi:hypothetical protein